MQSATELDRATTFEYEIKLIPIKSNQSSYETEQQTQHLRHQITPPPAPFIALQLQNITSIRNTQQHDLFMNTNSAKGLQLTNTLRTDLSINKDVLEMSLKLPGYCTVYIKSRSPNL